MYDICNSFYICINVKVEVKINLIKVGIWYYLKGFFFVLYI